MYSTGVGLDPVEPPEVLHAWELGSEIYISHPAGQNYKHCFMLKKKSNHHIKLLQLSASQISVFPVILCFLRSERRWVDYDTLGIKKLVHISSGNKTRRLTSSGAF